MRYVRRMEHPTPLLIAGESFDDLLQALRRMPITRLSGRLAQVTFNYDDTDYVNWTRAAERYAADLLTTDCDLSRNQRLELATQRVADEVERELRRRRSEA